MKRWKIVSVVLLFVVASQIPFAYRRLKLRRLSNVIHIINSQRHVVPDEGLTEYVGVMHVHSFLGGHSSGSFSEIIEAATSNQLNFVIMTEHAKADFDTSAMTLQGMHGGV